MVNQEVYTLSAFMQNSFKLGKGFTAELSGFYNSPSIWQGFFRSKAIYSIDAGIQKTVFKGKGTLKVAVGDVFDGFEAKLVGAAVSGATFDATTGHPGGEGTSIVVTAFAAALRGGLAAEFGGADDERVLQQAA